MLEPFDDHIVLQRAETKTTSAGGIVIPESAKEKSQRAKVVAVGPGRTLDSGVRVPVAMAVGDVVLIDKYSCTEVKVAGEDYVIVREGDILVRIEKDA